MTILAVAATTHLSNGFFRNWFGSQGGEGFEYHLLGIAIAAAIVVKGSGAVSLDEFRGLRVSKGDAGASAP